MTAYRPEMNKDLPIGVPLNAGAKAARVIPTELPLLGFLFVMCLGLSILSPSFLTSYNFLNILSSFAVYGIMACGMTFVIISGGIDISVGSLFAFGGAVTASLLGSSYTSAPFTKFLTLPTPLAVLGGVFICALLGLITGLIVSGLRVPPFIATLSMMGIARGLTYVFTGGFPITFPKPIPSFRWLGSGFIGPLPSMTVIFFAICILCWWLLSSTSFGRDLYAIGGNEEAARFSGIRVGGIKTITYVILGALSGLSGIIMTSRIGASPEAGLGYELDVITIVVIGGARMSGGQGSMLGTVIGILIMGILSNGLNLLGVLTYYQYLAKGIVLMVALIINGYQDWRKR